MTNSAATPAASHAWILPGMDPEHEAALRDAWAGTRHAWRSLNADEIARLEAGGNHAADWTLVRVADPFDAAQVRRCELAGLVRIGPLQPGIATAGGLRLPVGLRDCLLISSDVGAGAALHGVRYLAHTIIGAGCVLLDVGRIETTPAARFGCSLGADSADVERIECANENGGRAILIWPGMSPGVAELQAQLRLPEDQQRFAEEARATSAPALACRFSRVGPGSAISHTRLLSDVQIGAGTIIEGAEALRDCTLAGGGAAVRIGAGAELHGVIAEAGARVLAGARVRRCLLGEQVTIDMGARVTHSVIGANSTIACCEVGHSLIGPFHEQHHNNSFLIAATIGGQSNIAAGATIGSNHNSRAKDGELVAARGFWPGLCASFKHPSRFAPFTLLAKGDYQHELDIRLPFSLVANSEDNHELLVMPAYFLLYNMYALGRNAWKFGQRDRRAPGSPPLDTDWLAPDTAEAMLAGRMLIARAVLKASGTLVPMGDENMLRALDQLMEHTPERVDKLTIFGEDFENSRRPVRLLKPRQAFLAYGRSVRLYAWRTLAGAAEAGELTREDLTEVLAETTTSARETWWMNLAGQLVPASRVQAWQRDGGDASCASLLATCAAQRTRDRVQHACAVLAAIGTLPHDGSSWALLGQAAMRHAGQLSDAARSSRAKDFTNPYRRMTCVDADECAAVFGRPEDDAYLASLDTEADRLERLDEALLKVVSD